MREFLQVLTPCRLPGAEPILEHFHSLSMLVRSSGIAYRHRVNSSVVRGTVPALVHKGTQALDAES